MKLKFQLFDRREFLGVVSQTALLAGLGTAPRASGASQGNPNPFAYDVTKFQKTDPKLIGYAEGARWRAPRQGARRLALGPDDQPYVCAGNYLSALTPQGRSRFEIELPQPGTCVAVAKNETIFVGVRDHIELFDAQGQRRGAWESPGKKAWLTAIALGEKDVFVADSGQRMVLRYDKSGKLTARIGEKNTERNVPGFIVPSPYLDVEVHRDGLLRVNNPGRHRVEAYTVDGDFEGAWGKPSFAIEGFCGCCNPIAIAALPDGRLVCGEKGLPRVKVYSSTGEFESVVAGVEAFPENAKACSGLQDCTHGGLDVAVDSQGGVYVLDFVTSEVRVFRPKV